VVPFRQEVLSLSATRPAALVCTEKLLQVAALIGHRFKVGTAAQRRECVYRRYRRIGQLPPVSRQGYEIQMKCRDRQFTARYNGIMLITFCVVLLISCALIAVQVIDQARHDDVQLTEKFRTRAIAIDNLIVSVTEHLRMMQGHAQAHFLEPSLQPSRLFVALAATDQRQFALDRIPAPFEQSDVGNLTGEGDLARLPSTTSAQLAMALALNP